MFEILDPRSQYLICLAHLVLLLKEILICTESQPNYTGLWKQLCDILSTKCVT